MADDGAALSLDDYIKVKKKQGAFKIGRGGVKFQTQGRNRKVRANPAQRSTGGGNRGQINNRNKRGKGRYFGRGAVSISPQRQRGGYRNNNNRSGNRQIRQLMTNNFQGGRYQFQNRNARRGYSQNLVRQARQRLRPNPNAPVVLIPRNPRRFQRQQRRNYNNFNRNITIHRATGNRKAVLKLARKRVNRARLQLNKQSRGITFRPESGGFRSLMPLLSQNVTSGIRRTRTGFVTVSNPLEKQLQRLVVKEKIQKAHQIKINRTFNNNVGNSSNSLSPARGRQQGSRQQMLPLMTINNSYQPTYRRQQHQQPQFRMNRNETQSRSSLNHNQRSIPVVGMSMYADREEDQRMRMQHQPQPHLPFMNHSRSSQLEQQHQHHQWVVPPPSPAHHFSLSRTTVNNMYDPNNPAIATYDDMPHALNPDIQRKINFIQNHGNRSSAAGNGGGEREIIPDFRAPVSSSNMKLGDRFKMYMQ